MHLLCTLGLRVTEVVDLNVSNVDLDRALLVRAGTTRKRQIALPDDTRAALARYLAEGRPHLQVDPDERALFLNHRGRRLTRQGLWLIVKRYATLVGIAADVTPHTLRQSFALHQIERGLDPKRYADAMGSSRRRSGQDYRRMAERIEHTPNASITIDGKPYRTKKDKA
jgi:integrase/recombinase XerD